jgi:hypothetical protein
MPEDEVVEIIQYIEGLSKQEKLQVFAYLFDELIQSDSDDILQIEWDWIEDMLPYWCEDGFRKTK